MDTIARQPRSGWAQAKLLLALSRTPHGLLDLATPALGPLLWLGGFPPPAVVALGIITAFAGYTAVYALNDLVDMRRDRRKMAMYPAGPPSGYLDAIFTRHPLAQGLLDLRTALGWTLFWAILAAVGAYLLNPVCLAIFVAGSVLEVIYCLMIKVTHWRVLVTGLVKTSGGMAAVFAVDPNPSPWFLGLWFVWLFLWEVGGQNVPADWYDLEEDTRLGSCTLPVWCGAGGAGRIVLATLSGTVLLSLFLTRLSPAGFPWPLVLAALGAGGYLLLWPAWRVHQDPSQEGVAQLFNQASYYPLSMLVLTLVAVLW